MEENMIFRGIKSKYKDDPLLPSAMRKDDVDYMEQQIKKWLKLHRSKKTLLDYQQKIKHFNMLSKYSDIKEYSAGVLYSYFLSLVNISIYLHNNQLLRDFCKAPIFSDNNNVGVIGRGEEILDICFDFAYRFFNSKDKIDSLSLHFILHDYALFQHLNHTFYNKYKHNIFPTLVMDWTFDRATAEKFGDLVVSIDYSKYKDFMNIPFEIVHLDSGEIQAPVFGASDYTESDNFDNKNMQDQKGVVIFWPWIYRAVDLNTNELGKAFAFKVIPGA